MHILVRESIRTYKCLPTSGEEVVDQEVSTVSSIYQEKQYAAIKVSTKEAAINAGLYAVAVTTKLSKTESSLRFGLIFLLMVYITGKRTLRAS